MWLLNKEYTTENHITFLNNRMQNSHHDKIQNLMWANQFLPTWLLHPSTNSSSSFTWISANASLVSLFYTLSFLWSILKKYSVIMLTCELKYVQNLVTVLYLTQSKIWTSHGAVQGLTESAIVLLSHYSSLPPPFHPKSTSLEHGRPKTASKLLHLLFPLCEIFFPQIFLIHT